MKVKPLKWKKVGDGYAASTVFNQVSYTIQTCQDSTVPRFYVYDRLFECGKYKLTLEDAQNWAFEGFRDYLKYEVKLEIDRMKKETKRKEKLLSKCLEGTKS